MIKQWMKGLFNLGRQTITKIVNLFTSKNSQELAKRKELAAILNEIDYSRIARELPFFQKVPPVDVNERIEYLGELTVEIEKREIAAETLSEKICNQQKIITEQSWPFMTDRVRSFFEVLTDKIFTDIKAEYSSVTQVVDQGKVLWEKAKTILGQEKKPLADDFLARIMKRHITDGSIGAGVGQAAQDTTKYIEKEWNEFVADGWDMSLKGMVKLEPIKIDWDETLVVAGGSTAVAAGSTVILAMGWHTLGWAAMHFFPPMMLAAAVATVWHSIANRDKAVKKIQESAIPMIRKVAESTLSYLEREAKPKMILDIQRCAEMLIAKGNLQIWGADGNIHNVVENWKLKIEDVFKRARIRYTTADSCHYMEIALKKARQEYDRGELVLAARYYEYAFNYFLNWCASRFGVSLYRPDRRDFQVEFIADLAKVGFNADLRDRINQARKFRNECAHESLVKIMKQPDKFEKDYAVKLKLLGGVIDEVKDKVK